MWSLIWSLFKAARYLLPFIQESIRVKDKNDPEDSRASYNLRKLFIDGVIRFMIVLGIVFLLFYKILPLYSDNIYLRSEIAEQERMLEQYKDDMERLRGRLDMANENAKKAQSNLDMSISHNVAKDEEIKRISNTLAECRQDVTELRVLTITGGNTNKNSTSTHGDKHEGNSSVPLAPKNNKANANNNKQKSYDYRWDHLE